jgi:hypothetical protein
MVFSSHISADNKELFCVDLLGNVVWRRTVPSLAEWERFASSERARDVARGVFLYVADESPEVITVVYTSSGGLDMNISIAVNSGEICGIREAR